MTTKLHIGNMPRTSTNNNIVGLFRPFGLVSSVVFTKDPVTGLNTGCGTVEMNSDADASRRSIDSTLANTVDERLE